MLAFWARLYSVGKHEISHMIYSLLYTLHEKKYLNSQWIETVKDILLIFWIMVESIIALFYRNI